MNEENDYIAIADNFFSQSCDMIKFDTKEEWLEMMWEETYNSVMWNL